MTSISTTRAVLAGFFAASAALSPVVASAQSRSLIPAETLEVMLQRQDTLFGRMDLNRDNAISSTEIQVAMAQARRDAQTNGGQGVGMGGLSALFMLAGPPRGMGGGMGGPGAPGGASGAGAPAIQAAPGAQGALGGPGGPGGPGGQPQRMQMDPAQFAERLITALDTDGDSQINRAEMRAATEARFKAMDRNGDGVLSDDERPRMRFQGGPGGQQGGQQGGGMTPPVEIPSGDGGF
jgi:hypothetical protein